MSKPLGQSAATGALGVSNNATNAERAVSSTMAANMAVTIIGVATGILAARLLGPAGEGELAAIQTWPLLLGTLAMLGLPEALVFFISREPRRGRQFTSTAAVVGLLSSIAVGTIAWLILPALLSAQGRTVITAARVFLLVGPIYAVVGVPTGALRGAHQFTAWNLYRVAPTLAWLCALLFAWASSQANPVTLSHFYLIGVSLVGLPFLFVVAQRLEGPLLPNISLTPPLLRFGLPSVLTSLPQTVNIRLDQVLIIAFLPARLLGLYVVAIAWSGAIAPLLGAVGSVLFPFVSAERDATRRNNMLTGALQGTLLMAVALAVVLEVLAPFGIPLIFGGPFRGAVPAALVLVPAGGVLAWGGVAQEGLRGLGRPGLVLASEIAAAIVTLATLPELLWAFGILGAAIASLIGYSVMAVWSLVAVGRVTDLPLGGIVVPTGAATRSMLRRLLALLGRLVPKQRERAGS